MAKKQSERTNDYYSTELDDRAYASELAVKVAADLSLDDHEKHMVYTALYYAIRDVRAYRAEIPF